MTAINWFSLYRMLRELRLQYVYKPSAFVFSLSVFTYLLQVPGEFRILAQNFKSIQNVKKLYGHVFPVPGQWRRSDFLFHFLSWSSGSCFIRTSTFSFSRKKRAGNQSTSSMANWWHICHTNMKFWFYDANNQWLPQEQKHLINRLKP